MIYYAVVLFRKGLLITGMLISLIAVAEGQVLSNKFITCKANSSGGLEHIYDIENDHHYSIPGDCFTVVTDKGIFSNKDIEPFRVTSDPNTVSYYYKIASSRVIELAYFLRPEAKYVERSLTISEGADPLTVLRIEYGNTAFAIPPKEVVDYNTFWNASTVTFLRWRTNGLFCGIENPFFKTVQKEEGISFYYDPSLVLGKEEAYQSDPQFIGVYIKRGKTITDHYPQTVKGYYPRFRNPDGHKPLDLNEIKAMRDFVAGYLDVSLKGFRFINYHFFYPLPQMPAPNTSEEKLLLDVVERFHELDGDLFIFNPMYPYKLPAGTDTVCWELAPEGSAAKRIMDKTASRGIGSGFYMGCARYGKEGTAGALPFMPDNKDWKKCDEDGNYTLENCMASDAFANWLFTVQNNTITKYDLKLWSWDPGPGNGKFCYNTKHGHLPGKGEYKGWRSSTDLIRKLKEKHPDLFLMAFYGRKEYGVWGLKYFDQHESYWEQTVPFQASVHPDIHADRMNADGIRFQSWWNQNFRFLPSEINHVLSHRIQEGFWDIRLPKAWDYTGWRYSVMSGLACGGSLMNVILPDRIDDVPGLKEFYAKWLKWGRDNFHLAKYNIPFGEQVRVGGVDGWARIYKKQGFIFLCNPNPRPSKITYKLDEEIGLYEKGAFTLKEIYPSEGGRFFDAAHPNGLFHNGDRIECVVPAYQIVLVELAPPETKALPNYSNNFKFFPVDSIMNEPVRMLDHWSRLNGNKFLFPYNRNEKKLELETEFFADNKIRRLLEISRPKNLNEIDSLIPVWKEKYPDNFMWTRPDRLWLVIPSENAGKIKYPRLVVNQKNVDVQVHSVAGKPIIHYADITDDVQWGKMNKIKLLLDSIGENQFLGPYLDYPEDDNYYQLKEKRISSLLPQLYANAVVYDHPVDKEMPVRAADKQQPPEVIKSAMITPEYFRSGEEVIIAVKLSDAARDVSAVWISLPPSDTEMEYDKQKGEWFIRYTPDKRENIIMDVSFLRIWAVLKNDHISKPVDIPVKWKFLKEQEAERKN